MEGGWMCSLCQKESAESFCYCGNSETFLCRNCVGTHFSKFPKRLHQNLPIAAYAHYQVPGYFDRFSARTQAVEAGKEALLLQLQSTDRCLEEITTKVNELYQRLWEAGQKALEEVRQAQTTLRETVQRSIEEAESTVYEDRPLLAEVFSSSLREFSGEFPFTLFQYEVRTCETVDSMLKVTVWSIMDAYSPSEEETTRPPAVPDPTTSGPTWTCSKCGTEHPLSYEKCCYCSLPSLTTPHPQVQNEPKTDQPRTAATSMVWTCSCMYEYNLVTAGGCVKCGLPNPLLPQTPAPNTCAKCGIREVNLPTDICSVCESRNPSEKPQESSHWTCVKCQVDNNRINEKCRGCQKSQEELYSEQEKVTGEDDPQKSLCKCETCGAVKESKTSVCTQCSNSEKKAGLKSTLYSMISLGLWTSKT